MQSSVSARTDVRRPNLSEQLAGSIRERVALGAIAAGVRINEVHLARALGVSRTPLREALMSLVAEGSIAVEPRRGFFARPLTLEEFQQLHPIRVILDPAALSLAGLPSRTQVARLRALNRQLMAARTPERVVALDDAWHLELLAHSSNHVLLGLIRQFMARTHRYELVLMREQGSVRRARREHAEIMAAITVRDLARACAALRRNMESGNRDVLAWLERRKGA